MARCLQGPFAQGGPILQKYGYQKSGDWPLEFMVIGRLGTFFWKMHQSPCRTSVSSHHFSCTHIFAGLAPLHLPNSSRMKLFPGIPSPASSSPCPALVAALFLVILETSTATQLQKGPSIYDIQNMFGFLNPLSAFGIDLYFTSLTTSVFQCPPSADVIYVCSQRAPPTPTPTTSPPPTGSGPGSSA